MEICTGKPFGDMLQDRNNIHEERARNQKFTNSPHSFVCNLDMGVVTWPNVDAVSRRYNGRTDKTNTKKTMSALLVTRHMVNADVRPDMLQKIVGFL